MTPFKKKKKQLTQGEHSRVLLAKERDAAVERLNTAMAQGRELADTLQKVQNNSARMMIAFMLSTNNLKVVIPKVIEAKCNDYVLMRRDQGTEQITWTLLTKAEAAEMQAELAAEQAAEAEADEVE